MWWIVGRITVGSFDNNKITFRNRHLQLGGDFFMSGSINKERMIEMKKEEKYYQIYRIHLLNGEVIEASEEYDLPVEKGLVRRYLRKHRRYLQKEMLIVVYIRKVRSGINLAGNMLLAV